MARPPRIILLIESSRAYGRGCLHGIGGYLRSHPMWQIFHLERGLVEDIPPFVRQWDGDGVICRIENVRIAEAVASLGLPTVDLRGVHRPDGAGMLDTDPQVCGQLAAEHFIDRGFRHFAFCGYEGLRFSDQRRDAFIDCVGQRGYSVSHYESSPSRYSAGTLAHEVHGELDEPEVADWLATLPKPVGVFTCNDVRGRQVLAACAIAGLAVPDQIAVLGVDNDLLLCDLANPPLSSIEPDTYRIGYLGAEMLHAMLQGEPPPEQTVLVPPRHVAIRRSSDVIAVDDAQIAAALRHIRDHACERIGVEDLLSMLTLSRSTLERRFQQLVGRTPKQEIDRVRIERVRQLLAETDYPLSRIGDMAGYTSAAHLSTAFKRQTGQTPGQYRASLS